MKVAIAGAGIGGLTAALALSRAGIEASIYERAERLEEAGAGIQLTPNALNVLFNLGLGRALEPRMVRLEAVLIRQGRTARLIQRLPLDLCERRWGAPYVVIHRADLQAVLLAAVQERGIPLFLGHEITDAGQEPGGARLQFACGRPEILAPLLIGADGLWSTVRKSLGTSSPPRFAGKRAWRSILPMSAVPDLFKGNVTGLWLGERAHLVHYPVKGGAALNLVAVTADTDSSPGWSTPQDRSALLPRFDGWALAVRDLLRSVDDWRTWPLFDRPPAATLAQGSIALLGDAAHPMLPFVAQGGASAIEDAAELAAQLKSAEVGDWPARLQSWSSLRLPRVTRLQEEARRNGERYHWRWPRSAARDLALAGLGGKRMLDRYHWIYSWKPGRANGPDPQMP